MGGGDGKGERERERERERENERTNERTNDFFINEGKGIITIYYFKKSKTK